MEPDPGPPPPRFFCDAMLGRLARWLRALGFDTAYESGIADADLRARARAEDRVVLTRDHLLAEAARRERVTVVSGDDPRAQLVEVMQTLGLSLPERLFTRCTVCNTPLEELAPEEARAVVPPRVSADHRSFTRCPSCGRVYWEGGHVRRMRSRLADVLSGSSTARPPRR